MALPWVPGITLAERLSRQPLILRDTVRLGGWLMRGLGHAHGQGILHGDLKPSNIIVNEDPELRRATLIDFGLSRSNRIQSSIRDLPLATVRYLSPEQAGLIDGEISERSDLYSAGAVLFECLAGRPLVGRRHHHRSAAAAGRRPGRRCCGRWASRCPGRWTR